jgi:hypothetical protein
MSRNRRALGGTVRSKFDVPLAGWLLSLAAFVLGTVVPPIYNRLTFDGVIVGEIAELNYIEGSQDVYLALNVKVANVTKGVIAIETVETNARGLSTKVPLDLQIQDVGVVDDASGDVNGSLPILVPPEKVVTMQVKQVYTFPAANAMAAEQRRIAAAAALSEIRQAVEAHGFELSFSVNGKTRRLTVRAGSNALTPLRSPPPPPLPPPPPPRPTPVK